MSYSIRVNVEPCTKCGHQPYYSWDPTYNYGPMFGAAFGGDGLYDLNGMRGAEVAPKLRAGIEDMRARPDYFRQFNSDNGWGEYGEGILEVLTAIADACERHPDAILTVW